MAQCSTCGGLGVVPVKATNYTTEEVCAPCKGAGTRWDDHEFEDLLAEMIGMQQARRPDEH